MKRIISVLFCCLIALECQAIRITEPNKCPDIALLKSLPFSLVYHSPKTGNYQPYAIDFYDTNDKWLFAVFIDQIKSAEEALAIANDYLSSLYGKPVPIQDGIGGYTCLYMTDYGFAFSVTPPLFDNVYVS